MYTMRELKLWEAEETFGMLVVEEILQDAPWRNQYPKVFEELDGAPDNRTRDDTLIPVPMLKAMSQVKTQVYVFFVWDNALHAWPQGTKIPDKYTILSAAEALEQFGTEGMYYAADKGTSDYPTPDDQYILYSGPGNLYPGPRKPDKEP